jgi:hypothetical protein
MAQAVVDSGLHTAVQGEELELTLQVVLVGLDGLVLASDRRMVDVHWVPKAYASHRAALTQKFTTSKLLWSESRRICCAFAGGPQSSTIAAAIARECDVSPLPSALLEWQHSIEIAIGDMRGSGAHIMDEVIVLRSDSPTSALRVLVQDNCPSFVTVASALCTGHTTAPAVFVPAHLYHSRMSVSTLKSLALLTIGYGSRDNPSGVGCGADLITLNHSGKFSESNHSPEELEALCCQFDQHARRLFD